MFHALHAISWATCTYETFSPAPCLSHSPVAEEDHQWRKILVPTSILLHASILRSWQAVRELWAKFPETIHEKDFHWFRPPGKNLKTIEVDITKSQKSPPSPAPASDERSVSYVCGSFRPSLCSSVTECVNFTLLSSTAAIITSLQFVQVAAFIKGWTVAMTHHYFWLTRQKPAKFTFVITWHDGSIMPQCCCEFGNIGICCL